MLNGQIAPRARSVHDIVYWNDSTFAASIGINLKAAKSVTIEDLYSLR